MPDDEVSISASLQGDIVAALGDVEEQIDETGGAAERLGDRGRAGGKAFADGMNRAARGAERARDASGRYLATGRRVNENLRDTGRDSRIAATGLDKYARSARRAARNAGGFAVVLSALKWGLIITSIYALAGGLSAVGAGAVIAVGGLAPMAGVLAGALPLWAATKLSMAAVKLAGEELDPTLERIKSRFTDLAPVIARGGLRQGLDYFADSLGRISALTGRGLASLGGQLGNAARQAGNWARSAEFLAQVERIFHGLEPIVGNMTKGLLYLARALINVLEGAIPMAQSMAAAFAQNTRRLQLWTAEQLANGRMAAWLNKAWETFRRTIRVVADFLVGLFNIFRIAAGHSAAMGASLEDTAAKFRAWTESAEGQARINQYFQDSLPALREMGRLIGMMLAGFGGLAANANVAPLLAQIRTELGPAIADLVANLSGQGGLGPATISAAAAMVRLIAAMDFSALTLFLQVLADIINGILWVSQNVPGAGFVLSALLGTFLGFKLLGPVFAMVAGGAKAFAWIAAANKMTGDLSTMQKLVGGVLLPTLRTLVGILGGALVTAIKGVGLALKAAFITTPIGWIVLAIAGLVAGFIWLWQNVAGFRDFFIGVWRTVQAVFWAVVNAMVTAWTSTVNALKTAFQAAVNFIVTAARWIWDHGLGQVIRVIVTGFRAAFAVVSFIVQTAVYLMVAVISLLAVMFEAVWKAIVAVATAAWNGFLKPIFDAIGVAWNLITSTMSTAWQATVGMLTAAWNAFYNGFLAPIFNAIGTGWTLVTGVMRSAWQSTVGMLTVAWNGFKSVVGTVVGFIRSVWSGLTSWLAKVFTPVGNAIGKVFSGIGAVAEKVAGVLKGAWNAILTPIKGVWNFLARAWNAIPSITVPDWVPGIGGETFGLPKLPLLWHGGTAPGGNAIVGELGPEPLVRGGRVIGMVGQHGPEVANIPPGGYVVPALDTLRRMPGLTRTLPADVAAAVSRSVPGYGRVLAHEGDRSEPTPPPAGPSTRGLERALAELTAEMRRRPPPVIAEAGDVGEEVERVMRKLRREDEIRAKYTY